MQRVRIWPPVKSCSLPPPSPAGPPSSSRLAGWPWKWAGPSPTALSWPASMASQQSSESQEPQSASPPEAASPLMEQPERSPLRKMPRLLSKCLLNDLEQYKNRPFRAAGDQELIATSIPSPAFIGRQSCPSLHTCHKAILRRWVY